MAGTRQHVHIGVPNDSLALDRRQLRIRARPMWLDARVLRRGWGSDAAGTPAQSKGRGMIEEWKPIA